MARYNWPAGRICVVYYAYGSSGTDVYYTYKPGCTNCNYYGWERPHQLNDVSTNDQFMPSIDFNSSGNLVVPFYDRRNDGSNLLYDEYAAYITPNGTSIQPNLKLSTFQSNPQNSGSYYPGFIGDYQDVWDDYYPDGESATSAWIAVLGTGPSEDYLTRIFY
jgi:hypothetical protein